MVFDELKPLPPAGYTEVITGPARRATGAGRRLSVEPALVERLLAETAEGADALPLLALTLARLYRDFGGDGDLTLAEYESVGGMAQVVQTEVDQLLAADPEQREAQLAILHDAFIPWLATINPDNDQPMRRVARWADLPEPSRPLVDALVGRRLMVKDIRNDEVVAEVALESLLRQWDDLAAWLRNERQNLKTADDLERNASAWVAHHRDPAWLLPGTRLNDAEKLALQPQFARKLVNAGEYLVSSRQAEDDQVAREKKRRNARIRTAVVMAVIALGAVAALTVVDRARDQISRARDQALAQSLLSESHDALVSGVSGADTRALQLLLAGQAPHDPV